MKEYHRRERFIAYAQRLRERFHSGMLSQLQGLPQWVVWRAELEDQKRKKVPYNPQRHLVRASVKIPKSWGTLDQTLHALGSGNYSGLGFMITPPLVMIDLDNSYDRATQTITNPQAEEIMREVNSFFEASPYNGLKGLVYVGRPIRNLHTDAIEIYGYDRFTTITTDHIPGTPTSIELRTREVEALYHRFAPVPSPTPPGTTEHRGGVQRGGLSQLPPEAARDSVLQRLLNGDTSAYQGDVSRAEFVCLMKLMHYTGDDRSLTKAIFSSNPIGQRAKAREDTREGRRGDTTYLDYTIDAVLRKRRNPPQRR